MRFEAASPCPRSQQVRLLAKGGDEVPASRLTEFATLDADQKKLAVAAGLTLADLPE
jgi:hypothetical protein